MSLLSENELKNLCVELIKENVKLRQVVEMQNKILLKLQGEVDKSERSYKNFIITEKSFIDKFSVK